MCEKAYEDTRLRTSGGASNGRIEEFREVNPSPAATASKQCEMNNLVRENAVSWAEKAAAQDQRNYLVSNT